MSNFNSIIEEMKECGMQVPQNKVFLKLQDAETILSNCFKYFLSLEGKEMQWMSQYDLVIEWLKNNEGKGLLLYGTCGQGKTVLSKFVLPAIILKYHGKIVRYHDTQEMNSNLDEILSKKLLSLDDVGTEDISVSYGNKRLAFAEIMDAAEKQGKLIIISTNLTGDELKAKYGERIYDRLLATTKRVLFTGKSLRT